MWRDLFLFLFSLLLLAVLIWKNYWKFESRANQNFLGPYTPDYFRFSRDSKFRERVIKGTLIAKDSTLVVCGMIRDGEARIAGVRERVGMLKGLFRKVKVLIVENDSKDSTRQLLLEWAREDPDVEILGCGINSESCTLSLPKTDGHRVDEPRLRKMASLRNVYRDRIDEKYSDFSFVLVWDIDVLGSLYIDGFLTSVASFASKENPDGVCANGLYIWPGFSLYYDTFAHKDPDLNWTSSMNKNVQDVIKSLYAKTIPADGELKPLTSCFSGATLYKISSFLKNRYDTDGKVCEHDSLSKGLKMFLNTGMIHYILLNE